MILTPASLGLWNTVSKKVFRAEYRRPDEHELKGKILGTLEEREVAAYIHIPYCTGTCWFCPYVRYPIPRDRVEVLVGKYVGFLKKEISMYGELLRSKGLKVIDVHAGGGTPSLVPAKYWREVLEELSSSFEAEPVIAIEANPEDLKDEGRAYELVEAGVREFSLGVQSFHPELLSRLGRRHGVEDSIKAYENLRGAGAKYVNIDLMYMIPGQTLQQWVSDLDKAASLGPDEITAYPTLVLESSVGYKMIREGRLPEQPGMELFRRMVYAAEDLLTRRGYLGLEIYGYSKHPDWKYVTVNYEMEGPLLGFGVGAMGFTGYYEYQNTCYPETYADLLLRGKLPVAFARDVSLEERAVRYTTCRLFICRLLDKKDFEAKFKQPFNELLGRTGFRLFLRILKLRGDVVEREDRLALTRKGLFTAHKVTWAFVMNVPCRMVEECLREPLPNHVIIP